MNHSAFFLSHFKKCVNVKNGMGERRDRFRVILSLHSYLLQPSSYVGYHKERCEAGEG